MDRISGLSDELLIKILLFLPTKAAVSTSLLSKRWEFLWMWLPRLKYVVGHRSETEGKMLQSFLDRNLGLHRAPVLESLCLQLSTPHFKPEDVKLCVLTAVSLSVRELEISYFSHLFKPNILPSSLYACKSLVSLKLSDEIFLDVPRSGCLASLKTLELQNLRYFFNEDSFRRLLSICPVLKHLSVHWYRYDSLGNFTIKMQSLESLSIFIPSTCHLDGYVIDTPSLKHFKLIDHNRKSHYCLIENMPELCEAYVDVEFPDIKSLMGSIKAVKRLSLCSQAMYGGGVVFNRLKHLTFCVCKDHSLKFLVRLLIDSPNLRVLDLDIRHIPDDCHEPQYIDWWNQPSSVPKCVLSSLQTFKWSYGYKGTPEQRDFVVYILENARSLKIATILSEESEESESEVSKLEMIKELSLSSRASAVCRLVFD